MSFMETATTGNLSTRNLATCNLATDNLATSNLVYVHPIMLPIFDFQVVGQVYSAGSQWKCRDWSQP